MLNHEIVEVTLLEEAWNSDYRARRSTDSNLPDRLTFAIPVARDKAVIRMTRSKLLPVVMSDGESTRAANSFSEDASVFTDLSSCASMIVRRQSGSYMLRGTFVHQDVAWILHYETRHQRDVHQVTGMPHLISPYMAPNISNVGERHTERMIDNIIWHVIFSTESTTLNTENNTAQPDREGEEIDPSSERPTRHVVEIAFIVDFEDYCKWVKYVGMENTVSEMRLWYTFVAESINIRYQNIKDPDIAISTTVTVLRILNETDNANLFPNCKNTSVLIGEESLESLQIWYQNQDDLPTSDHYMLFTGLNLVSNQHGDIYGNAFLGTLCTVSSVSVVENDFNENVGHTCTHELAHSMSSDHDEENSKETKCDPDNLYIMSGYGSMPVDPAKEGNTWKFSPCSIASFKSYLR
ncbi:unnamed protein product, partial [Candidula unifasciata]